MPNKNRILKFLFFFMTLFMMTDMILAQTTDNNELNKKQQAIVPIAAFTATGKIDKLHTALNEGLDAGLTVNEIKEIIVQMYAYAGFPRSLNGLSTFMTVVHEQKEKGIKDEIGKEAGPFPADKTVLELGTEIQTKISGAPVKGPLFDFAPAIDFFLKDHLFGDIFGRDNLDFQSREIATIAALASLDGVESQLQSHFRIGMNVGLAEGQLRKLISVLETTVGQKEANRASNVLNEMLGSDTAASTKDEAKIIVVKSGTQPSVKGSADWFTGNVRIDPLFPSRDNGKTSAGMVTFEPGARTAWHTHPIGQSLVVTSGVGRVQQWGGEIQEIKAGDVVWFPAGVKHWHGASPTTALTHIAIQEELDDSAVEWLEHVSDEQYDK